VVVNTALFCAHVFVQREEHLLQTRATRAIPHDHLTFILRAADVSSPLFAMLIIAFAFTNTRVPRYEPIDYGCSRFDVPEAESPYVAPLRILNGDYVPLCSIVF
jgi:hypothetical protein